MNGGHQRGSPPQWRAPDPFRDPDRIKEDEFRKQLLLAAMKCGEQGWILVLLDADDDCPAAFAADILQRARQHVPHRRISVVLANREYEAWFIASAPSLHGCRGFQCPAHLPADAEKPRNAKGWIGQYMKSGTFDVVLDQPAFTASFDLEQAYENSRSFRKLCKEWQMNIVDVDSR